MSAARCPDCEVSSAPPPGGGPEVIVHLTTCPTFLGWSLTDAAEALEQWAETSPPSPGALLHLAGIVRTHATALGGS